MTHASPGLNGVVKKQSLIPAAEGATGISYQCLPALIPNPFSKWQHFQGNKHNPRGILSASG